MAFELKPFFPGNMSPPMTPHAAQGGFPCTGPYLDEVLGGSPHIFAFGWFRRLPANMQKVCLAARAYNKRKGIKVSVPFGPASDEAVYPYTDAQPGKDLIDLGWYDEAGNELDPNTGRKLTDKQLLKLTGSELFGFPLANSREVEDFAGAIPDPMTWEPAAATDEQQKRKPILRDAGQVEADLRAMGLEKAGSLLGMKISDVYKSSGLEYMVAAAMGIYARGYTLQEWAEVAD